MAEIPAVYDYYFFDFYDEPDLQPPGCTKARMRGEREEKERRRCSCLARRERGSARRKKLLCVVLFCSVLTPGTIMLWVSRCQSCH